MRFNISLRRFHTPALLTILCLSSLLTAGCCLECAKGAKYKSYPGGGTHARIVPNSTFKFIVMSDTCAQPDAFKQSIQTANLLDPDFAIDLGGLIDAKTDDPAKIETQWNQFDTTVKDFKVPFVMVAGNTDIYSPASKKIYQRRYGRTNFSFNLKNVHFVALGCETLDEKGTPTNEISDEQLRWLERDLYMNNNAMNKFLFLHQPYWTTSKTWMKKVHPILARHRVTAVFAGRNSDFLKGEKIDGVQYCITGPTAHHLCLITIRPTGWKLALVTPNALHPN